MRCYLIRQIDGPYLSRDGGWIGTQPASRLLRFNHRDEALNRVVEMSVQNPDLRLRLVEATVGERDRLTLAEAEQFRSVEVPAATEETPETIEELPAA